MAPTTGLSFDQLYRDHLKSNVLSRIGGLGSTRGLLPRVPIPFVGSNRGEIHETFR